LPSTNAATTWACLVLSRRFILINTNTAQAKSQLRNG
jgi:hypothetical protein